MARIPLIDQLPEPTVNRIPNPVVNQNTAPPVVTTIDPPIVNIPFYVPPSYEPPQLTPDVELSAPGSGSNSMEQTEEPEELGRDLPATGTEVAPRPEFILPGGNVVPLPYGREVALAGTTAVAATAAALVGKSLVEWMVKRLRPIVKKIILKIKEKSATRFTDYELQLYFQFEGKVPEQKQVAKRLKVEQKAEKQKQLEEHLQRQRQHKH